MPSRLGLTRGSCRATKHRPSDLKKEPTMNTKHYLSILVQNQPGVLARVSGMFAARGFNIDSLVVGRTEDNALSRMTIATRGDDATLEQIRKQLGKIVSIVKVRNISEMRCVERDLLLIRVHCPPDKRGDLRQITEVFRGSIVDVGPRSVMIQMAGPEEKVESFIDLCRPYGIIELSRTGVIAAPRALQAERENRASGSSQHARSKTPAATQPTVALPPS